MDFDDSEEETDFGQENEISPSFPMDSLPMGNDLNLSTSGEAYF